MTTPSNLPPGWQLVRLADSVAIVRGVSFPSDAKSYEHLDGYIGCLRTTNVQREVDLSSLWFIPQKYVKAEQQIIQPYDILISTANSFELVGKVAQVKVLPMDATLGAFISLMRPHNELDPKFIYYQLASTAAQETIRSLASTTTNISNVSTSKLAEISVALAPLPEQRRIVAEIERQFSLLDAGVAGLKRVQANLKRYRASVLQAACEGRLVPTEAELARTEGRFYQSAKELLSFILADRLAQWAGRGNLEHLFQLESPMSVLPEGWTWAKVDQLASPEPNSITDGPFGSNLKTEHYTASGPRVVRLQNIGEGVYLDEDAHISESHFERLEKHRVFEGDIVIAAFGANPPRSCIIPERLGPAIVKADCIRLNPHRLLSGDYISCALNSEPVRKRAKGMVHGVGRPRLNLGEIKSIVIPLPPLAEQHRIVDEVEQRLSIVEELEAIVAVNLQRAARLRQAILQRAFAGKLVPATA